MSEYMFRLNTKQKQCHINGTMTIKGASIGTGLFTIPSSVKALYGALLVGHSIDGNMCVINIPSHAESDQTARIYGIEVVTDTYFFDTTYFIY